MEDYTFKKKQMQKLMNSFSMLLAGMRIGNGAERAWACTNPLTADLNQAAVGSCGQGNLISDYPKPRTG